MDYSQTKNIIVRGFVKVLANKSYEKIKVADIIQASFVNKATFYRYFSSKKAVVCYIIDYFTNEMHKLVGPSVTFPYSPTPFSREEFKAILWDLTVAAMTIIEKNRYELGVLITFENEIHLKQALLETYYEMLLATTCEEFLKIFPKEYIESRTQFLASGVGQIVENWLLDNLSGKNIETIVNQILDFTYGDFLNLYHQ